MPLYQHNCFLADLGVSLRSCSRYFWTMKLMSNEPQIVGVLTSMALYPVCLASFSFDDFDLHVSMGSLHGSAQSPSRSKGFKWHIYGPNCISLDCKGCKMTGELRTFVQLFIKRTSDWSTNIAVDFYSTTEKPSEFVLFACWYYQGKSHTIICDVRTA